MIKRFCILALYFLTMFFALVSCTSKQAFIELPSSNYSYRVKSLIIHFTAVNYEDSVKFLVNEGGGVSSHYLIPQLNDDTYPFDKIKVMQLVDERDRAWHAGVSYWQGRTGLNDSSIGIEIVNEPECIEQEVPAGFIRPKSLCIFPEFESRQIELLIPLIKDILARNPDITPTAVIGHSDIAPSRKNDPGPRFPWQKLYEAGIGAWYDKDTVAKYWQMFNHKMPSIGLIQKGLHNYGYGIKQTGQLNRQTQDVLGAFQMHFIPWQVNYSADSKTAATLFALLEKYFPEQLTPLLAQYENDLQLAEEEQIQKHSQLSMRFTPQLSRYNNRVNRQSFISDGKSSVMHLSNNGIISADIFVNEQALNLGGFFNEQPSSSKAESFSIAKRSYSGLNTIRVANVKAASGAEDPHLHIAISYPAISNQSASSSGYDFSTLDELLKQDIDRGFPGASILVLHKGKIIKNQAYGFARKYADGGALLASPQSMTPSTLFDLASNTKVFATTLSIMKLHDEGKLTLDSPIANYLPDYSGDGRDTRTIADLLSHSSGYNSEVQIFKSDNPFGEAFFSQEKALSTEVLLGALPFSSPRRSQQVYSDTNFLILGLLVERISGMTLDEYVESQIYSPLGLTSTVFNPLDKGFEPFKIASTEIRGNTRGGRVEFENIRDYVLQGEVHDEKAHYSMQGVAGHAGLFSTTEDLAVLAQLLLNGGGYGNVKLFSQHTLNRFIHPEHIKDSIGLGWRLASDDTQWHFGPYASPQAFGHTGWTGTAVVIDPALDVAVIYLTNKKHSEVIERADRLIFEGDTYPSASYANVMALVYESIIKNNAASK